MAIGLSSTALFIFFWMLVTAADGVLRDYCLRETFEAKCHHNEVAVMTSARYGRRQLGKCIRKDFGYLGCGQEVINQADRICSGRQQCFIDVFKTFGNLKPCSELESYLEADYDCIPVIEIEARHCLASEDEWEEPIASEGQALISSYFAEIALRQGQSSCTLQLKAKPGQRWNISLVDFGVPRTPHSAASSSTSGDPESSAEDSEDSRLPVCRQYATVRDERSAAKSVVCGGGAARDKVVHLSTGHHIQVEIFSRARNSGFNAQFLLRVEAIGCPDVELSNAVVVWRDAARMQIRCNTSASDQLHEMVCINKIWTGDVNCNREMVLSLWQRIQRDWSTKPVYGILLMTLLGIILGIIIGCSMLAISLLCRRRKWRLRNANELQKTVLVRKTVDSLGRSCPPQPVDDDGVLAATDFAGPRPVAAAAAATARAVWPLTAPGGARIDNYFIPHKCSLRTRVEVGNGRDQWLDRQLADLHGSTKDGPIDDGCRYHACLQKTSGPAATAETEVAVDGRKATPFDGHCGVDGDAAVLPMYAESSGYGNSLGSLSTAEHIYEIPE